jgi:hypothetical protein
MDVSMMKPLMDIVGMWGRRSVIALLLPCCTSAVMAAEACKVIDPELQGHYSGPCVNGLAQGQGSAAGTARYTGNFVAGRKHGKGLKVWANGDRYEGDFVNDLRQGQGVYRWGAASEWAGQRYVGAYVADRREGLGTYEWPDGRKLSGQWQADLPSPALSAQMPTTIRIYAEKMVHLRKPGAKVCRTVRIGISEDNTIEGVVLSVTNNRMDVRIEKVGKFGFNSDGNVLSQGQIVSGDFDHWQPCQ